MGLFKFLESLDNNIYLKLQVLQKDKVKDPWQLYNLYGKEFNDCIYAFLPNDEKMIEYYPSNILHNIQIPYELVVDISDKCFDFNDMKKFILNNLEYKAFIFNGEISREVIIIDPNIIEILK